MRSKTSSFSPILSLALFLPLAVFALVSCGANPTSTSTPTPTPTSGHRPTVDCPINCPLPSTSFSDPHPLPSPTTQKCGTITLTPRGTTADTGHASNAGDCFWQAYQQCHLASFTMNVYGVDTVTTRTFTLAKKNNQCLVTETVQHRVVPGSAGNPQVYTCATVSEVTGVLHFEGCGTDDTLTVLIGNQ